MKNTQQTVKQTLFYQYEVTIEGVTPYSPSKNVEKPKDIKAGQHDAFDEATWKQKAHVVEGTNRVIIPPMAFKQALVNAAKYTGTKIPGAGSKTYTQKFESGVMIHTPMEIGQTLDTAVKERIFCNADGIRGSAKRVYKSFPVWSKWRGVLVVQVLDVDIVTPEILEQYLNLAGKFVGVGRWRPEKGGTKGMFRVVNIEKV